MRKENADRIILEYVKPIYGFAVKKAKNDQMAEELAASITFEVYKTLLHKNDIENLNAYIFTIAQNTWAKYITKLSGQKEQLLHDSLYAEDESPEDVVEKNQIQTLLRREIAFLSQRQRLIIVMHYFHHLKIKDIAKELKMSISNVKWHLHVARKELNEGMQVIREVGELGINPISFGIMSASGSPGKAGDTADICKRQLTQNILWYAYQEPRTIKEIAKELGMTPVYLEDEIHMLVKYSFLKKLPGDHYQTDMFIYKPTLEKDLAIHTLYESYASQLVDQYFMQFKDMESSFKDIGMYYPNHDYNLLLWSILPCAHYFLKQDALEKLQTEELSVSRVDGGDYIAYAVLNAPHTLPYNKEEYDICCLIRSDKKTQISAYQNNMVWDGRGSWKDTTTTDFVYLYHFIQGNLAEDAVNASIYCNLIEKGFLTHDPDSQHFVVQLPYLNGKAMIDAFHEILPKPNDETLQLAKELDDKIQEIYRRDQPHHALKYAYFFSQNSLSGTMIRPYIIKEALKRGLIKEVNQSIRKSIGRLLFIE